MALTDTCPNLCVMSDFWDISLDTQNYSLRIYGRIDSYDGNVNFSIQQLLDDMVVNIHRALNRLYGAFAGLLQNKDGPLIIFNDHHDLESWYWAKSIHGQLILSPKLETILLRCDFEHFVDSDYLALMLSPHYVLDEGNIKGTRTAFKNVSKLDFASVVTISSGEITTISRYWDPCDFIDAEMSSLSQHEAAMQFRDLFVQVIREQIFSTDQNFATELSGGIDSGCVTSTLGALTDRSFKAITVPSAPGDWGYEMSKIQDVLTMYPHIEHVCTNEVSTSFASSLTHPARLNMPEMFWSYTSNLVSNGVPYLFSGEGADWYLEGSDYIWDQSLQHKKIGQMLKSAWFLMKRGGVRKIASYATRVILPQCIGNHVARKKLYDIEFPNLGNEAWRYPNWVHSSVCDTNQPLYSNISRKFLEVSSMTWESSIMSTLMFPPLHKWRGVAQTRMVFPFYDKRLMEFGLSVPNYLKFTLSPETRTYYGSSKQVIRKGMTGIVPESTLRCQRKATYSFPMNNRVRNNARQLFSQKQVLLEEMGHISSKMLVASLDTSSDDNDSWIDTAIAIELWLRRLHQMRII